MDWLKPDGTRGWATVEGMITNANAICAALNVLRFALLKRPAAHHLEHLDLQQVNNSRQQSCVWVIIIDVCMQQVVKNM